MSIEILIYRGDRLLGKREYQAELVTIGTSAESSLRFVGVPGVAEAHAMLWVGLRPISLDNPGKMTGQRVTHEIVAGGAFDVAADRLLATGFRFRWQAAVLTAPAGAVMPEIVKRNKVKFSCPDCEQNAWGAPTIRLICGKCQEPMVRCDSGYR